MTKNKTYGEGFYIIGGISGGKVRLSKEGRRMLGINKKKIKEQKFFDLIFDTTHGQR